MIRLMIAFLAASLLTASAATRPDWPQLLGHPQEWYAGPEARRLADHVVSHQTPAGDWPKNLDTVSEPFSGDTARLRGTFDNGATVREVAFLARVARATSEPRYRAAVHKAIRHVLDAQYPNGGWPQSFPPGTGYARHITFNDGTLVHLLDLCRKVASAPDFDWLDAAVRDRARQAVDRGIDCILRCQVRVEGRLTAWCAQHDEVTFEPRPARAFEPVSLSGGESAGILVFLMSLPNPSAAVADAIRAGVAWFEAARITGLRYENRDGDRVVEPDPLAPPLWARFYEIGSNTPIFTGRDGIVRRRLADIELERRTGYAWYGRWGDQVAREHAAWSERHFSAPAPDESGFVPLLTGSAAGQWKQCGPGRVVLRDGVATCEGGMGLWWFSGRSFTNFVLRVEFLQEQPLADSGVFLRFPDPGNDPWVAVRQGHEVEIGDPEPEDPTWRTGSLYPFCASTRANTRPPGEWNDLEIRCVGQTYVVWINGEKVTAWTDPDSRTTRGFVGLQNYDDGKTVRHRRLRIKDLP